MKKKKSKRILLESIILSLLVWLFFPIRICGFIFEIGGLTTKHCYWTTTALFIFNDFGYGDFEWPPFYFFSDFLTFLGFSIFAIFIYFLISLPVILLFYFIKDKIKKR